MKRCRATCRIVLFFSISLGVMSLFLFLSSRAFVSAGDSWPQHAVMDRRVLPVPPLTEPKARVPFVDPLFGTSMVRVTDRKVDIPRDDSSRGLKNEYSRIQAFNADESLMVLRGINASWYLYDAVTLKPLKRLPFEGSSDPRWDAKDPYKLYFIDEARLKLCDIRSGTISVVHQFTRDFPGQPLAAVWTRYEGSPSGDGRYWGLMAEDDDWKTVELLIYDAVEDRITARRKVPESQSDIDWVSISPLGTYFLAAYNSPCAEGSHGDENHPGGLMVYDRSLSRAWGIAGVGHCDLALDARGREVLAYQDNGTDWISMADLATGRVTPLLLIDFSRSALGFHFSGRSLKAPGWVLVSTYNGGKKAELTWMDNEIFALELKSGGRLVRLAHHHSWYDENVDQDYWAEPHGTVNRDFTRILFTSNWGRTGTEEVDTYMIRLPAGWMESLK
jgi:hypothetical protein